MIKKETENIIKINPSVQGYVMPINKTPSNKKYKCSCCGNGWDSPKSHFNKSTSPLYANNDGYINICYTCRDKYYDYLVDLYDGNEVQAIKHFCQMFDILYDKDIVSMSQQTSPTCNRLSNYLSKKNLSKMTGTTFTDGLIHEGSHVEKVGNEYSVTEEVISRWGVGFSESDYNTLEEHYRILKEQNPNCDNNQEIFIKDLCILHMLKMSAVRSGDIDKVTKVTTDYRNTFKQAGLKTINDEEKNADDCWGLWCAQIAQFTPEEYYKDKKLFADFDGIKDYFERFVKRPIKNLMYDTKDRDEEFSVKGGDADDI